MTTSFFSAGRSDIRCEARVHRDREIPVVVTGYHDNYPTVSIHLTAADALRLSAELLAAVEQHQQQQANGEPATGQVPA